MTTTIVPQPFRKPRVAGEDFPLSNHDAIHTRNVKTVKKHCACHHELVRITAPCERQLPRTRRVGLERSLNGTGELIGLLHLRQTFHAVRLLSSLHTVRSPTKKA